MSKILVSVMPFAGHVSPITGVVAELLARGHDVTVYTGSRYVERFDRLGARAIPWTEAPDFDEYDLPATFPEVGRRGPRGLIANIEHIFVRSGFGQARDIVAIHDRDPFDLIVSDVMSIGGSLAAELLDLPWATLSIVPLLQPSVDLPPTGLALHPGTGIRAARDSLLRAMMTRASAPLERVYASVRSELGLPKPRVGYAYSLHSPWLVLATGCPSIEYPRTDLGRQFHFVGRLPAAVSATVDLPEWWPEVLESDVPVVLVTQGTFNVDPADLVIPSVVGLSNADALVVATTVGATVSTPLPANARTADFLPFADLLPHVSAVISNGGWGGVLEVLAAGLPLIVAGGDLDKPEIAARVAWSGAGIDLRTGHPKATAIATAYERLRAGDYAARAREIGDELRSLGGTSLAVDLIEQLSRENRPVLSEKSPWG